MSDESGDRWWVQRLASAIHRLELVVAELEELAKEQRDDGRENG